MSEQPLKGKVGIVFGVANKRSIAWAIAKAWADAGATLIFNYQGERLKDNVAQLLETFGEDTPLYPCDVSSDEEIDAFFENVKKHTDKVDLMLHSVAFAPREALEGNFLDTTRDAYKTMSYYGAEKVVPHYNVMGVAKASLEASTRYLAADLGSRKVRVNCISAGPVQTLAARGISGFGSMIKHYEEHAPLERSCTPDELGATGLFLASEGAASITGQVLYVDGGYQIMGM